MADEEDIDALLEESFKKGSDRRKDDKESRKSDKSRDKSRRSKSRDRSSRKDKDRDRDKDRERDKESKRRKSRSRSKESKRRNKSPERRKRRSKSRSPPPKSRSPKLKSRSPRPKSRSPKAKSRSPRRRRSREKSRERSPREIMTPEERDARTVFVMQLSNRCRARDIEEFFSSVGKVRDIRLIMCNKTRRFKGIAYVEFKDIESVALAHGLNGQKLLGVPVIVQASQAEKNRVGISSERLINKSDTGPMRLYVGSLHFNITEEMLRGIFEPFGQIMTVQILIDTETQRSRGYGFITYAEARDAKRALEQMNGFELAGRPIKVGHITEKGNEQMTGNNPSLIDYEDTRSGYDLGATGRLALMAKLAEGTGMKLPDLATQALANNAILSGANQGQSVASMAAAAATLVHQQQQQLSAANPPIATQCFLLSNMFDPATETLPGWESEIRDDVIEECNKHGGVLHIFVDSSTSQGNVYVKCTTVESAVAAVNSLHGRWFAGKVITAAYVPLINYHSLFAESISSTTPLQTYR